MATLSSLPPSPWPNSNPNSDFTPQNDDLHSPIQNPNPSSDQHPNDDVDDDLAHAIDNLSIQNPNPNSDSVSQPPSLLHVTFNQDYGCFSSGTDRGFRIYNCDPFRELFRRDFDAGGGIGIVEMLFRCNILALVGGGSDPQYPLNKVMIWDDHQSRCIGELTFRSEVRGVRLRRDSIVVVLEKKVLVYNFADLKLLHQIETFENPKGLCEVSQGSGSFVLVCFGLQKGQVRVEHYASKRTKFVLAHDSRIACLKLAQDGHLLATASTKGTLVRIFNTYDGTLLQEVRRGVDRAEIYSLAFSSNAQWLAVSSDKGTVHVFSLKTSSENEGTDKLDNNSNPKLSITSSSSSLSFIKGMDQSNDTQNSKKGRVSWRNEFITKTFLEACIDEINNNGRLGTSLKPHSWVKVGEVLKKTHNFDVDARQMRNRYDYLKSRYTAWCQLKAKTGNHYDPTTNTFNFTEEEWKQHSQGNKFVETLKTTPLSFPELCTSLYDGAAATGVSGWGPSSKRSRTIDIDDDIDILNSEDNNTQYHMDSPHTSTLPGSQSTMSDAEVEGVKAKKKNKTSSKQSKIIEFENEMSSALKLMVQTNSGPSLKECKDKLNSLGWGSQNPLHQMALGIFCESAKYREQWMLLDEDENEHWVKMVSAKLGFNA